MSLRQSVRGLGGGEGRVGDNERAHEQEVWRWVKEAYTGSGCVLRSDSADSASSLATIISEASSNASDVATEISIRQLPENPKLYTSVAKARETMWVLTWPGLDATPPCRIDEPYL